MDIDAEKIERLRARRGADLRARPGGAARAQRRSGCTSRPSSARRSSTRGCCSSPSARRRPTPATPTCRRCTRSSTRSRPPTEHALVMKSTVPCGTGAAIQRVFGEQGKAGLRYVSCPEFLKEGSAVEDFLHPDRVVVGDDGDWAGDAVVELYAPLQAPLGAHRHRQRRDDQARRQRLPRDEDLVHQRDRQRLRGDRRRRRRGRARDGPRRRASARSSCRPGSATAAAASPRTSTR